VPSWNLGSMALVTMGQGEAMSTYRTAAGSLVEVSGAHRGIIAITFDWFEEGACCEAHPCEDLSDAGEPWLRWHCECCGGGYARLARVKP
jgi:hypothetical protein